MAEMLRGIATALRARGCILWQEIPRGDPKQSALFVLADFFEGERQSGLHTLPLVGSVTGTALCETELEIVNDIKRDGRVYKDDAFFERFGIRSFCSIRVTDPDTQDRTALNIYRDSGEQFDGADEEEVRRLAAAIPELLRVIRNDAGFHLIGRIHSALERAEASDPAVALTKHGIELLLKDLSDTLSNAFRCVEVAIYLGERPRTPADCHSYTTWGEGEALCEFDPLPSLLTRYAFEQREPVLLVDPNTVDRKRYRIADDVPLRTLSDMPEIEEALRQKLDPARFPNLPPLSMLAVPIYRADKTFGVIRCRIAYEGPYFFTTRDREHLEVVAAQVARYWSSAVAQLDLQGELRCLRELVESIGKLNNYVRGQLARDKPDLNSIYNEALSVSGRVITGAEILDVRVLDESKENLIFGARHGAAWNEGTAEEIAARTTKKYSLKGPTTSAGAWVYSHRRVRVMADVSADEFYDVTFRDTKAMIIAPIELGKETFGVLDIRTVHDGGFPPYARDVARLLGRQLGLYSFLARNITVLFEKERDLETTVEKLSKLQKEQIQTFQDLTHQLKTPINSAVALSSEILEDFPLPSKVKIRLRALRGLCRKAQRVSYNINLFTSLASGKRVDRTDELLSFQDLLAFLKRATEDQSVIHSRQNIRFWVDERTFFDHGKPRFRSLTVDLALLEQAIMNLLDNAGKYSFEKTSVKVSGGRTGSGGAYISVVNRGIPILKDDIPHLTERGWRSEQGQSASGSGSGIGLWIVDHIMTAHNGSVQFHASTAESDTEIRLLFPETAVG